MNEFDLLKIDTHNSSEALINFDHLTRKYPNSMIYFIENKDAPYYCYRMSIANVSDSHPVICYNKSNVLDIYKIISSKPEYAIYFTAYFVDRDFDENLFSKDIYVTPCYSIENFYCTLDSFTRILEIDFGICPTCSNFNVLKELFSERLKKWQIAILDYNAWYMCLKRNSKKPKISLQDQFPNKYVDLKEGAVAIKKYSLDSIRRDNPEEEYISEEQIEIAKEEIKSDLCRNIRGKYEMQFLFKFLSFLKDNSNNKNAKINYITRPYRGDISGKGMISTLSQYAETPESLINYIKNRIIVVK